MARMIPCLSRWTFSSASTEVGQSVPSRNQELAQLRQEQAEAKKLDVKFYERTLRILELIREEN